MGRAGINTIIGMSIVLHRKGDSIFYCRDKFVPASNLNGIYFQGKPYVMGYVTDYDQDTGDLNLYKDDMRITAADYEIWLEANNKTFAALNVKYLYCRSRDGKRDLFSFF